MDHESEVIRQQMDDTRASLSEKLETLEQQVVGTVKEATSAVAETVENVKEAVQDTVSTVKESVQNTVETVKETFNLRRQFERHPWLMLGGSVAAGFGLGYLVFRPRSRRSRSYSSPVEHRFQSRTMERPLAEAAEPQKDGWLHQVTDTFGSEINKLKGLAVGTMFGVLRDVVSNAVPENLAHQLKDVVNSITTKLGGEVIHGPVVQQTEEPASSHYSGLS